MQDITVHHMDGKGLVKAREYREAKRRSGHDISFHVTTRNQRNTILQHTIEHHKLFAVHEATQGQEQYNTIHDIALFDTTTQFRTA